MELPAELLPGIDFSKPCMGLLTNVAWDAQLQYPTNAFPNILGYVMRTINPLKPGSDRGLDIICDGILKRNPFICPAEQEAD